MPPVWTILFEILRGAKWKKICGGGQPKNKIKYVGVVGNSLRISNGIALSKSYSWMALNNLFNNIFMYSLRKLSWRDG